MNINTFVKKTMHSILLSIGSGEVFMIMFVALILFGPKRIPEVARNLGKGFREFKKMKDDLTRELTQDNEIVKDLKDINDSFKKDPFMDAFKDKPEKR